MFNVFTVVEGGRGREGGPLSVLRCAVMYCLTGGGHNLM